MKLNELTNLIFEETIYYLLESDFVPIKGRKLNRFASSITRTMMRGLRQEFGRLNQIWTEYILNGQHPKPVTLNTQDNFITFSEIFPDIAEAFKSNQITSVSVVFEPKLPNPDLYKVGKDQPDDFFKFKVGGGVFGTSWDSKTREEMTATLDAELPYISDDWGNVDDKGARKIQADIRHDFFDRRIGDLSITILVPLLFWPELQGADSLAKLSASLNEFSTTLNSVVLHELEHSSHPAEVIDTDDIATEGVEEIRNIIKSWHPQKIRDVENYIGHFLSETEIKAYATGYMRIAKHNKVPIDAIVNERVETLTQQLIQGLLNTSERDMANPLLSILTQLQGPDWKWTEAEARQISHAIYDRHGELVKYYIRSRWPRAEWQEDIDDTSEDI